MSIQFGMHDTGLMRRKPLELAKEKFIHVSCSHPTEAIDLLLFSLAPTAHPEMDEALSYLIIARNGHGSCAREIRAGCRACPLTTTTHHASATDQATNLHENGSTPNPMQKSRVQLSIFRTNVPSTHHTLYSPSHK